MEELDPDDVAELLRRAADADRERQERRAPEPAQRARPRRPTTSGSISDALVQGLADPTPPTTDGTCSRAGAVDGEPPAAPVPEGTTTPPSGALEARLRAAEERAEEYAAKLRHARDDLAAADERARELAAELAARDADHDERAHALASERDDVEGRVRTLTEATRGRRRGARHPRAAGRRPGPDARGDAGRAGAGVQELTEQHAAQIQQLEADLEQSEQRARTLATETAARATEHSERVRALVAEREAAEERARSLSEQVSAGAGDQDAVNERATRERAALEQSAGPGRPARRRGPAARRPRRTHEIAALNARLEQAGAEPDPTDDRLGRPRAASGRRPRSGSGRSPTTPPSATPSTAERVDMLLADVEAAEHVAQEARRVAQQSEARMFEAQAEAQLTIEQRTRGALGGPPGPGRGARAGE